MQLSELSELSELSFSSDMGPTLPQHTLRLRDKVSRGHLVARHSFVVFVTTVLQEGDFVAREATSLGGLTSASPLC